VPQPGPPDGTHRGYPPFIPPITDADRAAAFPDVHAHQAVHGEGVHYFVLFDHAEWESGEDGGTASWGNRGWIGGDMNRFWFRTGGHAEGGRLAEANVHALYGRAIARWWDLVAGVRQDFRPGPARTWAAVGLQGLAPYWFELEATAYVGEGGRTHLHVETEYELLLTQQLVLQPGLGLDVYGRSDRERRIGSGLSALEAGVRLRYEIRREFAPYIGITWTRKVLGTAALAREAGEGTGGAGLAIGIRAWF